MMEWLIKLCHPHLLYSEGSFTLKFAAASVLNVVLCFVLLGLTASEYLCPNVAKLADSSGHGAGTLMAVLLAWCNCSPDLFSNFMSWTSSKTSSNGVALSIGEVIGACGIILCVVEGSIFIIMSSIGIKLSKGQKMNVLRDLAFTLAAIILLMYVCIQGKVSVMNCLTMMAVYVSYLVIKFKWRIGEDQERSIDNGAIESGNQRLDETNLPNRIKPSLISAMEINNILSMLQNSRSSTARSQQELISLGEENDNFGLFDEMRPSTEPVGYSDGAADVQEAPRSSPAAFAPYYDDPREDHLGDRDRLWEMSSTRKTGKLTNLRKGFIELFVPHLLNFREKSPINGILSVITAPFAIMLRLACPQPTNITEIDDITGKYMASNTDLTLLFVQSVFCPLFSFTVVYCIKSTSPSFIVWIMPLGISAFLVVLTLMFYKSLLSFNRFSLLYPSWNTDSNSDNFGDERRMVEKLGNAITTLFLSIGIINAILCISLIANSLIELLEIYQEITKISQAILGLTLFAWGNSIGDLISNIAMCRLYRKMPQAVGQDMVRIATKFFLVSCTSCIGGVLLNSMGGIGLSGLISMIFVHKSSSSWIILRSVDLNDGKNSNNYKLIISCIAIILQTIVLAIFFGPFDRIHNFCKGRMRVIGLSMGSIWVLATVCSVLLELLQ